MKKLFFLTASLLLAACKPTSSTISAVPGENARNVVIAGYSKNDSGVRIEAQINECVKNLEIKRQGAQPGTLTKVLLQEGELEKPCIGASDSPVKKWFALSNQDLQKAGIMDSNFIIINNVVR